MSESRCRSCGAEIIFATSAATGKTIPLDVAEVEPGPGALHFTAGDVAVSYAYVVSATDVGVQFDPGTWHHSRFGQIFR